MSTKHETMARVERGELIEAFSHEYLGEFNVTKLREMIRSLRPPCYRVPFATMTMVDDHSEDALAYLFANRDIDEERARMLTTRQLAEPVIMLDCPPMHDHGPSHLLIDGIHRLWQRRKIGKTFFRAYFVPLDVAPKIDPIVGLISELVDPSTKWGESDFMEKAAEKRKGRA